MITKRQFLAGSLGATAFALATGGARAQVSKDAGKENPKEFRIGYQKSSGILAVARQQLAFERALKPLGVESVKWVEFQFGPPLLEALGSGSVDIGTVGDAPPIFAQAAGANLLYVASAPATQNALLVPKDAPIRQISDLQGKRVAFAKGSSSHNFVVQALKKGGLTYKDIEPIFLAPADAAAAFAANRVDAWAVWDPYYALAQKRHDARALITTANGLPSHSFYLANKSVVERSPAIILAALDALRSATSWAAQNRDKVAALSSELTGVEFEAQKVATDRYPIEFNPVTEAAIKQQQEIADTFFALGLIPRQITVTDIVWSQARA